MATDANARLNLRTAAANVRGQLALSDTPSDWTYDERIAYNRRLAVYIQQYPQSFTPEILRVARTVELDSYQPLADTSFDWGEFAAETAGNAPAVLGGFTNKLLLGAVIVAAVYFAVKASNRPATA